MMLDSKSDLSLFNFHWLRIVRVNNP
jgi:hypothetical protein